MPVINADGCPINVQVEGPEGAPVLMLSNSLGTNLSMWDPQARGFAKEFRLIRYDRRGHGQSGAPKGPYNMERLGRDVLAVLDALKIEKTHWCGLSMGGMVGQWLGANAPGRMGRMILSNTACYYADKEIWNGRIKTVQDKGLTAIVQGTLERWFTKDFREREPQKVKRIAEMFLATRPEGYIACGQAVRDMDHREIIKTIKAPTMVIAGKQDAGTTVEMAEAIRKSIPGASMTLFDAAHIANVECQHDYTDAVIGFLQQK